MSIENKNISIISTLLGKGRFLSLIAKFMSFGLAQSVRLLGVAVSRYDTTDVPTARRCT